MQSFRRTDRYTLGAGDGTIFAPPHPQWLDRPGLWDGVQWYGHILAPAYTLTLVDANGREIVFQEQLREWTPDALASRFAGEKLQLTERRVVLNGARIASDCTIANTGDRTKSFAIVQWTALEAPALTDRSHCQAQRDTAVIRALLPHVHRRDQEIEFDITWRLLPDPVAIRILESQHSVAYENLPDWHVTPFREVWHADGGVVRMAGSHGAGRTLIYVALIQRVTLDPGGVHGFVAMLELSPVDAALREPRATDLSAAAHSVPSSPPTPSGLRPADASEQSWSRYFEAAPLLTSSNTHVERFFANRLVGMRLNGLAPRGRFRHRTMSEGPHFFHAAISYSAWCHMRELCWLDPDRAHGVLLTFLDRQREDGSLPGILHINGEHPTASYFADWGGSVLALMEAHPDHAFRARVYGPLARFAAWLDRDRDPEQTGLYQVRDPYETGQEYMSRYTAVDAIADQHHFDYRLALFGVDITVYAYRLHRALARIAAALAQSAAAREHDRIADRIGNAVRARMWDDDTCMFFDIDPMTGRRTGIKAAVCFYPYMTDIAGAEHVAGLERNLFDATSFWTPYPVPSTAADDATFDADGYWAGVRRSCPWNGRVWPMTNCHIAEALAHVAITHAPHLRARAADLILRTVRMMFFAGDSTRPNSYEHYSPFTGEPSTYRGIDDYMHSWLNDLIVRWIAGFRPSMDGFVVDPLPSEITRLRIQRLPFHGAHVDLTLHEDGTRCVWDGNLHESRRGERLSVAI